ncbi:outer membrane beta-barrel protein [Jejudonia soesokkakensis]|uniref:Outer membrane beta-barrel protein n=1 Tax=Jejudonia soesokkakensis TaxID=1323432 RepID=A0ABW2MPN4_9FLAO
MSTKKNIDQLFKERFENFEETPSPEVWKNIQSELKGQKEDRKVIPLWWKVAGIAALLALLFTIGNVVLTPSEGDSMVTEDTEIQENSSDAEKSQKIITTPSEDSSVASEDINPKTEKSVTEDSTKDQSQPNKKTLQKSNRINSNNKTIIASEQAPDKNKKFQNQSSSNDRFINPTITTNKETGVASTSEENSKNQKTTIDPLIEDSKKVETTENPASTIAREETKKNSETDIDPKKSIFKAIEETETAVATTSTKKQLDNRWEVSPNFAPVYYNSLSEGSSIDPSFSDNTQSGDVNFSYGVKVSYAINERLSIRSGVSNVDLSYATSGIDLATGPVSQALRSIDYGSSSIVTTAVDSGTLPENNTGNPFDNLTPKSASGEVQLIQNINYYEVPLELKYALVNSKFGVNILGGFSSLFLGDNEVSVRADNLNETLGEANNLSQVSFTTNVGLGLDYKISKKFKFNLEPMFKYQLNPYTDSSVNFRPYYLGVYTGFSYRF